MHGYTDNNGLLLHPNPSQSKVYILSDSLDFTQDPATAALDLGYNASGISNIFPVKGTKEVIMSGVIGTMKANL